MIQLLASILLTAASAQEPPAASPAADGAVEESLVHLLDSAEMAYWAAVQDYGSPELLGLAQVYLAQAEAMSGENFLGLSARRRSLEINVEAQQDMAHDTLRALFPGYRLLREGLVHEVLVDEPWAISTVQAASALRDSMRTGLGRYGQFDLRGKAAYRHAGEAVPGAVEERPDLLNEAFYILAENPRLWLDTQLEGGLTEGAVQPHTLLDLGLTDTGTSPPLWAVTATADLSVEGDPTGDQVRSFGFALDRRERLPQGILLLAGLLALALGPAVHRRGTVQQVTAAAGAFLLGVGVTAGLFYLVRDRIPAPDSLGATGLWGPVLLAVLSSSGPLLALGLAPSKLEAIIPEGLSHWIEREFGSWPAVCGGGAWLLGAVLLEAGLSPALLLAGPWLLAQYHATVWLERGAQRGRGDGVQLVLVLGAGLALALLRIPAEAWSPAVLTWAMAGGALLLLACGLGADAAAALMVPLSSLALLSGAQLSLLVLAGAPLLLELRQRDRSRGAGVKRSSSEPDGPTQAARLEASTPGSGTLGLPKQLGEALKRDSQDAPAWGRVLVHGGSVEDRELIGLSAAHLLAGEAGVATLRQEHGATDPLGALRALIPGQGSQVRQAVTGAAAMLAGLEPAERTVEEDQRILAVALQRWIEECKAPGAVLVQGEPSQGMLEVLSLSRGAVMSGSVEGPPQLWEIICTGEVDGGDLDQPALVRLDLGGSQEDREGLRLDYLVDCLGLDPELATLVDLESSGEGLGLAELHQLVLTLVRAEDLDGSAPGAILPPPVVHQPAFRGRVREVARTCAAGALPQLEALPEEQSCVLAMASHLGAEFSVEVVAEAAQKGVATTARLLAPLTDLLEDPDRDGQLAFSDPRAMAHLRRKQRIALGSGGFRWRQTALDDLRSLASVYLAARGDDATDSVDSVDSALKGLSLLRSGLAHGGDPARSRELLRSGLERLLENPGHYKSRRSVVVELVGFFLSQRLVPGDLEVRLQAERLRWEFGTLGTHLLPIESAWEARKVLDVSNSPVGESDDLRIEVACRFIDVAHDQEELLDEARDLLTVVLERPGAAAGLRARALYELARLEWRAVKSKEDPDGRYDRALEGFEQATSLAREAGEHDTLRRALRNWAEALSIPPKGRESSPLEQRTRLLEEALEVNRSLGDLEGQAMVLGTLGRANLYRVSETPAPPADELRESMTAARRYFMEDRALCEELLSMDGVIKMDTMTAQAEWQLGDFEAARGRLEGAEERLARLVGDVPTMDLGFILAGQVAEATRAGDGGRVQQLTERLDTCKETLGPGAVAGLRAFYSPHLECLAS